MPIAECQVAELKRAYQTLGVPFSASALSIKQGYRRIAKRWHPDLYPTGTPAYDEATQMMKRINEAFSDGWPGYEFNAGWTGGPGTPKQWVPHLRALRAGGIAMSDELRNAPVRDRLSYSIPVPRG